jgi:hypothetical protein
MHSNPRVLALVLACLFLTATESPAQSSSGSAAEAQRDQSQSLPDAPAPQSPQDDKEKDESTFRHLQELVLKGNSLHVTQDLNSAPMSNRQKFGLFARESVAPGQFIGAAFTAGISQAADGFSGYGQGASGYGKRFGAAVADSVSGKFFGTFLFPVILNEDPRYYRKANGSFGSRLGWALKKTFITRKDDGSWSMGYSKILGNVAAGTLSNAYYPSSDRGVGLTAQRAAVLTAFNFTGSIMQEFWPDVAAKLLGKKKPAATVNAASPRVPPENTGRK